MILISFLFLFQLDAFPQQGKRSYGIFSGVSLNTNSLSLETGNDYLDTSYSNSIKPAFNIGMYAMYDFAPNFGVKLMGQYTNKGGITYMDTYTTSDVTSIERSYRNTINYIQFSLLPQLNLPFSQKSPESKFYFNAGGYLSFKLSASENIYSHTYLQELTIDKDISHNIAGSDAGLIFGAGIIYKSFLFDLRYDLGLSNVVGNPDLQDVMDINNRSINFSIGYTGGF